jgi:hypothetical protein
MFAYFSVYADYNDYSLAGGTLGLKGQIYMVRGYDYFLTTAHFCWAPHVHNVSLTQGVAAKTDVNGYLEEVGGSLGRCNGTVTHLFPYSAAYEPRWLALTSRYLYEHDEEDLRLRRAVVESGTLCSEGNGTLYRSLILYSAQCSNVGSCQQEPSVPYRRLAARHTVHIQLPFGSDNATIHVKEADTMSRLPALLSSESATWIAVGQLAILVLVAAVSFVRSSQKAVSPSYILRHAFARCVGEPQELALHSFREVVVNAFIGVLALGARVAVLLASQDLLQKDNASRIVVSETVGCCVSLAHFLLRNVVLHTELAYETPLTKLGGPMSTIDVSCAILVALAETPLLATRETFSSVGRMLASLLVLVSGVQTLIYSSASCAMTASSVIHEIDYRKYMRGFFTVLTIATAMWIIQAAAVAVTLCSAFLYPFVFSLTRMTTGDTTIVRQCTLFGIIGTSLPTINRVTLKFARDLAKRKEREEEKEHDQ